MLERFKSTSANYIMIVFVAIFAALVLFCGFSKNIAKQENKENGYTVVDSRGNKIMLADKPKRIVSFAVSNDEMLLELVGDKRLIGISPWSENQAVSCIADKVKNIPYRVGQRNLEAILALKPDLVVIPDYVNEEVVRTLRDSKLNVYVCKTPKKIAEIKATIKALGEAVGETKNAQAIIEDMDKRLARVQADINKNNSKLKVMRIQENGSYYAPDSSFTEICSLAGVMDATEALHYDYPCTLSQEEIVALNPDVFVIENWNYDGKHSPEELKQSVLNNKAYAATNAVKNKKVILVPANHLLTVSHHIVNAVEDIAREVYHDKAMR